MNTSANDPGVPPSAYPSFTPVTAPVPPGMPSAWSAVALLHPFSPPQSNDPNPTTPFFQLCVANITCVPGVFFSAQIAGCESGTTWWYIIDNNGTFVSTDQGANFTPVNMGWSVPNDWFGGQLSAASCAGSSQLNWIPDGPAVDWWRAPVPNTNPPAATWMWFDSSAGPPVRMMFGQGPVAGTNLGDPTQLALFQMYSFTYIPVYDVIAPTPGPPVQWSTPTFPGFAVGNPFGFQNFVWNPNFGMTVFMTPVNEVYKPLPTRVLYVWKPDAAYSVFSDRAQNTLMLYSYNPGNPQDLELQEALLTGPAPAGTPPPPEAAESFLINGYPDQNPTCMGGSGSKFHFPQEAPDWVSTPGVGGTIQATLTNAPIIGPGQTVTIYSVLFPPSGSNYPDSTYLWTWYAPTDATGVNSRPITFMQSQSGVGVGTSLALADYFYYENFAEPIDPSNFGIPSYCSAQTRSRGLRRRLP